ncbi:MULTISPECIES: hypothetical protein [unclassified Bosea (in: a-proteobacteria)]|uniref:hypothetical protein n=1 Tax=unclassified Bosea (in: a-proteobacteria) TaxID=2653178 RepID=UPI00083DD671|nr:MULTISPECIES: hypothetical protein [unclassified Bosea (in: a-proteobacteria)]
MTNIELKEAVYKAVASKGGKATLIDVARYIWHNHEADLRASGDRFYKWQYEMRWAANVLRTEGRFEAAEDSPRGVWVIRK